ncbi:site-specific DNA-methyltransferase [Clostridium sp. BJN0013]|uniref:site-specific DNA-methyltransferase n=1 Tax=Clostridium sp. BJN0013 TaxID=3236840 RepID=UPI0034C6D9F7
MQDYMTLIHGECLNEMDKLIEQKVKVNLVLTDEPYGTTECKWDEVIPFHEMWPRINNLKRDIHTPVILFGREPFTSKLINSNMKEYKHKWIWNKKQSGSPQNAKYMPLQIDEDIIVFAKSRVNYYPVMRKGKMRKKGGCKKPIQTMGEFKRLDFSRYSDLYYPTNIIEIYNPRIGKVHPTQKPVELMEYLIKTYTKEGDLILDFAMGSGSTGVACKNLNRQFIGIEKEKKYYDIAVKRIKLLGGI